MTCFVVRTGSPPTGHRGHAARGGRRARPGVGAHTLEGYPLEPAVGGSRRADLYRGTVSLFLAAGLRRRRPAEGRSAPSSVSLSEHARASAGRVGEPCLYGGRAARSRGAGPGGCMSESRRLPARVYWVRRFVVLGIPLIIIAVVVWLFVGRDSGEDPAAQGGTSSRARRARAERDADGHRRRGRLRARRPGPRDDRGRHLVRAGRQRDVHRRRHQHRRASPAWWTPARRSARSSSRPAPTGCGRTATASCPAPRPARCCSRAAGPTRRRSRGTGSAPRRAARRTCPSPVPAPTPRS